MMKRIKASVLAVAFFGLASSAQASTWEMDMSHSQIGFSVRHMMVSNTSGRFAKATGTLELDDKDLARSNVSIAIETASVDTQDQKRDEHLRSPDFFATAEHPQMTFKSKSVKAKGKGYVINGDLTIRGVTRPVVLEVAELTGPVKDPWGNERRGATATAKINRKDFGIAWNKVLDAGGVAVGDEVRIQIEAEFIKKK